MQEQRVVCTKCAGVNRIPTSRSPLKAKCGKCGAQLFAGNAADVSGRVFNIQIAQSTIPVLVDVWAPWCGPCKMMAPAYEAAARQLEPHVRLIKLNSDAENAIAASMGIRGIPTMVLYDAGQELARTSGAMTAGQIVQWVRQKLPDAAQT